MCNTLRLNLPKLILTKPNKCDNLTARIQSWCAYPPTLGEDNVFRYPRCWLYSVQQKRPQKRNRRIYV